MYHTITFADDFLIHSGTCPTHRRERLLIPKGTALKARIRPYVVESKDGPIEVADLFFADGSATHMIPFEFFSFVG